MKRLVIAIIIMAFGMHLNAQDLIVTSKNDSINAKITKIKKGFVHFRFMKGSELRKTLLPLNDIQVYQKNFYDVVEIPSSAKLASDYQGKRFYLSTNAGFAFRTAKLLEIPDERIRNHTKDLKSGLNWGLDAHYLISEPLALGLKFNSFYSTATLDNIVISFSDGDVGLGLKSDIHINFIGPSMMTRLLSVNKKNALLLRSSVGYMSYKNEEKIGNRLFTSTGNTIGVSVDLGYDFGITDYMSIGFLASWTTGALSKIELEEGGSKTTIDLEEKEGLSRINISGGIRFHL